MVKVQAIFIVIILAYKSHAMSSFNGKSFGGGKPTLEGIKSQLTCLAQHVALPGAHYIPSVKVSSAAKNVGIGENKVSPTIAIIGNVDVVLRGSTGNQREWDVSSVGIAGIGAATLDSWNAVGEAIFVNGLAIIRPSDNVTEDYYHTKTSKKFKTQFSAFVTHEAQKDGDFTVNYPLETDSIKTPLGSFPINGSMFMSDFYSRLYKAVGKYPFCYAGLAQFANLEAIALSLAPIYNEPLFGDNKKKYYARPVEKLPGAFAFIVGCAANYLDLEDDPKLEAMMKMLLYKNPFDTGRPQTEFHGHAVTLKRCVKSIGEIEPEDIGEAFHMVNTARIKTAQIQVYVLKSAEQLAQINDTNDGGSRQEKDTKHMDESVPSGDQGMNKGTPKTNVDVGNGVGGRAVAKDETAPGFGKGGDKRKLSNIRGDKEPAKNGLGKPGDKDRKNSMGRGISGNPDKRKKKKKKDSRWVVEEDEDDKEDKKDGKDKKKKDKGKNGTKDKTKEDKEDDKTKEDKKSDKTKQDKKSDDPLAKIKKLLSSTGLLK